MTEPQTPLRARHYTYYEMLSFAQYYQMHRNENSPQKLLAAFLTWRHQNEQATETGRRLLVIEEMVVNYYGLRLQDVRGKRRYAELVRARQVIAYLSVKHTSQHTIAMTLGVNRNNVQFGKTKCAILMETEPLLRKEVAEIEQRLQAPFAEIDAQFGERLTNQLNKDEDSQDNSHGNGSPAEGTQGHNPEQSAAQIEQAD